MAGKRRLALFVGTAVILAIVLLAVILIPGTGRMDALLEEWKAAGGAETAAALKPESIPDERNAAVLYRKAFEQYDSLSEPAQAAILSMELTDESIAALDELDEAIDLALRAASRTECQWNSPIYDQGLNALLPHLGDARNLARVLLLEAERSAQEDTPERAIKLLIAVRRLSEHTTAEPIIVGMLVAISIDYLALNHFRQIFTDRDLPPMNLKPFLARGFDDEILHSVVLTEGTLALEAMREDLDDGLGRIVFNRDAAFFLESNLRILEEIEKPYVERDFTFMDEDAIPLTAPMSRMLFARWKNAFSVVPARLEMLNRLAHTAVELRLHRDSYGEYPESWDMPTDPITGNPMHYERTDYGFILRSDAEFDGKQVTWEWQ